MLWARVLETVRPLRVAPKPVAKVVAKVVPAKVVRAAPPKAAPLAGKKGAGSGSSAVQMFQKLLDQGLGSEKSQKRATAARPHANLSSEGEGPRKGNTLDGSWDRKLSRGLVSPDASIDLHGHNLHTAYATLDGAMEQSIRMGDRVILLVTGKPPRPESERPHARGAIRAAIGDWLAGSRHAAAIAAVRHAHPRHGGAGALYIILRRTEPNRVY